MTDEGRSGSAPLKGSPVDNSASGSTVNRCRECACALRSTKETIHNGLLLIRVRYGLPYCELPDCEPSDLGRFLSFLLLQGKERRPVAFPRRQQTGISGLCELQRLCRRDRWTLAHSVSSIKRNLPPGCRRHTPSSRETWVSHVTSQPPPPSAEFLAFLKAEVTRLFPAGWDSSYDFHVGKYVPNPSARKPLLSRADHLWAGRRSEFLTLTTQEALLPSRLTGRFKEVPSAGKCRPMLIFDESVDLLAPLHTLMYSHLRKSTDWLLCGPPTEERMASVCVNAYQTSVDLVAATDGLHHAAIHTILDALFFTSVKIPRSLRAFAKTAVQPFFEVEGVEHQVRHGQMQGAYLSFPLLCVQSYCAARWAARFDCGATFLVNGDDCVISASRGVTVQDYPSGYRLNSDKTIVAENVAEVNSTAFLRQGSRWREVRHLRRGGAPTDFPGMLHMAEAVVKSGHLWVDAYQRARIGRRWGFLPSQIGHLTYASHLREKQMRRRRYFTDLPTQGPLDLGDAPLRRITGRDPTAIEVEALRSFEWTHGRLGGLKRDVFSPSCGKVRRSYGYRARPCWSSLSYVGVRQRRLCAPSRKAPRFFLIPDWFETEEEMEGIRLLDLWRQAVDSLVADGRD